jgi:hypothetical protein
MSVYSMVFVMFIESEDFTGVKIHIVMAYDTM